MYVHTLMHFFLTQEGEWGWIIIICALLVQAINHGLQLGVSSLLVKADRRFHVGEPALLGK